MDSLLKDISFTNSYNEDILIGSKGSLEERKAIFWKNLIILESKNMAATWEKCIFFQKKNIEWLGFKISHTGVKQMVGKSDSI